MADLDEAEASLALAVADFEKHFAHVKDHVMDGRVPARAPTGELYFEIVEVPHKSSEDAIKAWKRRAESGLPLKPMNSGWSVPDDFTLYWRIRPEIDSLDGEWKVYSRLLISDLPEVN